MREFKVKSETTITDKLIAYIVITAFEGGSAFWCDSARCVERDAKGDWQEVEGDRYKALMTEDGCGPYANPEFWDNDKRGYRLHDEYEEADIPKVLTLSAILKALQWQQPKPTPNEKRFGINPNWYRKIVDRVLSEDYDAGDADAVVQIAVFNELVYG
jgi:hypothetical protein